MLKGKLAKMRTTDRKIREGNTFLILALMGFRRYDVVLVRRKHSNFVKVMLELL